MSARKLQAWIQKIKLTSGPDRSSAAADEGAEGEADGDGGGGAGWFSDGQSGDFLTGGKSITSGFTGGILDGDLSCSFGGFGGGGANGGCDSAEGGGGGGGYSGGAGGNSNLDDGGGGGGSYNSGLNPVNLSGVNSDHGNVVISILTGTE